MRTNYTADELLDTIGTGANWEADAVYSRLEGAVAKWNELGLRHMRTGIAKAGTKRGERSRIAHEALGSARLTLVADHPYWYDTPGADALNQDQLAQVVTSGYAAGRIEGIEVISEPDHRGMRPAATGDLRPVDVRGPDARQGPARAAHDAAVHAGADGQGRSPRAPAARRWAVASGLTSGHPPLPRRTRRWSSG